MMSSHGKSVFVCDIYTQLAINSGTFLQLIYIPLVLDVQAVDLLYEESMNIISSECETSVLRTHFV